MKRLLLVAFGLFLFASVISAATSVPSKSDYPHWNFNNKSTYLKLEKINNFIEKNKDKNVLAVFDWDGTLYNEHIPVKEMNNSKYAGQPAFYIWGANNQNQFDFKIFPMYQTKDGKFKENVIIQDKYLEGHTNINTDGYSKFIQTSMFTAGMTPQELEMSVNKFLTQYPPEKYAFLPMLDVLQKMTNEGFDVWIITGSNQYFVANMLKYIQKNIDYRSGEKFNFSKILAPAKESEMHIAGNGLKLMENNKFSVVYDNKYTKNPDNKLYIVDKEGKEIVVKNLENWENSKALFVAGNSDGDLYDSKFIINRDKNAFGIAVNPSPDSKLMEFSKNKNDQIIILNSQEI